MHLLNVMIALGTIGGIGLVIGTATGLARGRRGLPRWRALLMAALYPILIFPVAGLSVHLLLIASGIHLIQPGDTPALLLAALTLLITGLIAAAPSSAAAFFAHAITWNRHHAKKLGNPSP